MKKLTYIAVMAAAVLACNKIDELTESTSTQQVAFNATIEGTKTSINGTVGTYWSAKDEISIFGASGTNYWFQTSSGEEAASVVFDTYSKDATLEDGLVSATTYALYPYNYYAAIAEGVISTTIGSNQVATTGNYPSDQKPLLVAQSDAKGNLAFKQASAVVKFTIAEGTEITYLTFKGNNGEIITGDVKVALSDGTVTTTANNQAGNWASLNKAETETSLAAGTYYMVIIPQTFTSGFNIEWDVKDGYVNTKRYETSIDVPAGTLLNLGTISYEAVSADAPKAALTSATVATVGESYELVVNFSDPTGFALTNVNSWNRHLLDVQIATEDWSKYPTITGGIASISNGYWSKDYDNTTALDKGSYESAITTEGVTSFDFTLNLTFSEAGTYNVWTYATLTSTSGLTTTGNRLVGTITVSESSGN